MNRQLTRALASLLHTLATVRCNSSSISEMDRWADFGHAQGQLRALQDLGVITFSQFNQLTDVLMNAALHSGKPFPSARNAGPAMPSWIAFQRREQAQVAAPAYGECDCTDGCDACDEGFFADRVGKPSAQVPANEPESVSAPAPCTGLRLLCLLVKARNGQARALPVHTLRPMPPRVGPAGRWSLASDPSFVLRETHAVRPPREVLERCARHRQTNAVRAASRTVRTGCGFRGHPATHSMNIRPPIPR